MRIGRMKLKNYIGIYSGMSRFEIELDFTKTECRKILLLGQNGSGKSTIMSALTPFIDTFDDRKKIIIDGKTGEKEIDIIDDDVVYKIHHHMMPKKNKSFIKKVYSDGTEEDLNPAGNVTGFVEAVLNHLGVSKDFFKLLKIGSQSDNFIDLISTARKSFIGNFTPDVEPFLVAYKNVSQRLTDVTRDIKFIVDESAKLEDKSTIEKNSIIQETTIKKYKATIARIAAKLEVIKLKLAEFNEKSEEFDKLKEALADITSTINQHEAGAEAIITKYKKLFPDGEVTKEQLAEEIKTRSENITKYKEKVSELAVKIQTAQQVYNSHVNEQKQLDTDRKKLAPDNAQRELHKLNELLDSYKVKLENVTQWFISNEYEIPEFEQEDELEDAITSLSKLIAELNTLSSLVAIERPDMNQELIDDIYYDIDESRSALIVKRAIERCEKFLETWDTELETLDTQIEALTKQNAELLGKSQAVSQIIDDMPECNLGEDCKVTEYIHSLSSDNARELVEENDKIISSNRAAKRTIKSQYTQVASYLKYLKRIENNKPPSEDIDFTRLAIEANSAVIDRDYIKPQQEVLDALYKTKEINKWKNSISRAELDIAKYSQNDAAVTLINAQIKALDEKIHKQKVIIDELAPDHDELKHRITRVQDVVTTLQNLQEHLHQINLAKAEKKKLDAQAAQNQKLIDEIEGYKSNRSEIAEELESYTEALEEAEKILAKLRLDASRIEEYETRLTSLNARKLKLSLIKDSLDIKSGIPLVLVGQYLEAIKTNTNRLLNMAFKGNFIIDFAISDTEFSIPVYKNGVKNGDDIKECSQGEISMVKTSLSLGIVSEAIKSSTNGYNIACLDEIDAELDKKNRAAFTEILDRQLDSLDSEQCFIITHNDAFMASRAALILLPGNTVDKDDELFMNNKDVVFEF